MSKQDTERWYARCAIGHAGNIQSLLFAGACLPVLMIEWGSKTWDHYCRKNHDNETCWRIVTVSYSCIWFHCICSRQLRVTWVIEPELGRLPVMGLAAGTGSEKWSEEVERDELSTRALGKGIRETSLQIGSRFVQTVVYEWGPGSHTVWLQIPALLSDCK